MAAHKPAVKINARREARLTAWKATDNRDRPLTGRLAQRQGFKAPGSNKKPFPAGKGKAHR